MGLFKLQPRFDLGLRHLLPEWRALLSTQHFGSDLAAGLTVACIAVPLSLAIALASGVAPGVGLVTAIVGGLVCALFGGTPLQVSGPAAAMAVLIATIVQEHGMAALLVVGVGCGALQLLFGVLGLGRFVRLVPLPVIEGFTAGIGAIILIGQLPRALGLPAPEQSHIFEVVPHIRDLLHQTRPAAVIVTALTLALLYGLPRFGRRIPVHLVAVVLATFGVTVLGVDTQTIGDIPRSLPAPKAPSLPGGTPLPALAGSTFVVFALASLETLLSATAVDKMSRGQRSDPDQELIGQGLGNLASAFFGGIPITGVIARSGTNVQAGAKTRRSSMIHALALIATVFAFAPWMERIPIAALAAVLFSVAFRMLSPTSFYKLWKHSRGDGMVYAVTFIAIVFIDLLEGIQWGIVAALAIAAVRLGRPRLVVRGARLGTHHVFILEGPLTFMSSLHVDSIREQLSSLERGSGVVFDLRGVDTFDSSALEMLAELVDHARSSGLDPVLVGVDASVRGQLATVLGKDGEETIVTDERELAARLHAPSARSDARLRVGVERYRSSLRPRYAPLFQRLASGQTPHTLFITCSDSRVNPNLITATDPGELFIVRDIGNLVPPAPDARGSAVAAAIDYAVGVLQVSNIVVCGHSGCGAIRALLSHEAIPATLYNLEAWLERTHVRELLRSLPKSLDADEIAKLNVLRQIDHVRTYPVVDEKTRRGELSLTAWFFDVGRGEVEAWSEEARRFVPLGDEEESRVAAGFVHDLAHTPA